MQEMVMVWLIVFFMCFIIVNRMGEVIYLLSKNYYLSYDNTEVDYEYLIQNETR